MYSFQSGDVIQANEMVEKNPDQVYYFSSRFSRERLDADQVVPLKAKTIGCVLTPFRQIPEPESGKIPVDKCQVEFYERDDFGGEGRKILVTLPDEFLDLWERFQDGDRVAVNDWPGRRPSDVDYAPWGETPGDTSLALLEKGTECIIIDDGYSLELDCSYELEESHLEVGTNLGPNYEIGDTLLLFPTVPANFVRLTRAWEKLPEELKRDLRYVEDKEEDQDQPSQEVVESLGNSANPWEISVKILESFPGELGLILVGFALLAAGAVLTNILNSNTPDSATDCVPNDVTSGTSMKTYMGEKENSHVYWEDSVKCATEGSEKEPGKEQEKESKKKPSKYFEIEGAHAYMFPEKDIFYWSIEDHPDLGLVSGQLGKCVGISDDYMLILRFNSPEKGVPLPILPGKEKLDQNILRETAKWSDFIAVKREKTDTLFRLFPPLRDLSFPVQADCKVAG